MCIRDSIRIANKLGISKNTVFKYNIELFQAGLLKLFPDRLELTPNELLISNDAVSYTHLDVYKRQLWFGA